MIVSRKKFLQAAGFSALAALGEKLIFPAVLQYGAALPAKALKASRWAMAVDLGKCLEGCTACMKACHEAHNVPEIGERSHRIEWIWKSSYRDAFPSEQNEYQAAAMRNMQVPLFCNHCDNPPCVRVCPTQATWKRADGIVMMDWHRCIGCRYCMAACPYGSRSFNWTDPRPHIARQNPAFPTRTKGVVEKCNFCEERLAKGELPACVNACPHQAMAFSDLGDVNSPVRQLLRSRFAIRRRMELGSKPEVFYIV